MATPQPKPTTQIPDDYIPTWDEIGHLLLRGEVAEVAYDTETIDTNRNFNAVLDLGMATADLSGRVVDTLEVSARVPDHRTIAPQAALVNRRGPEDWDRGVSQHELAGRMADALRRAPRKVYDSLSDEETIAPIKNGKAGKDEVVRKLYYRDEQGDVRHARLHAEGKFVSIPVKNGKADYTDEDGTKWRKMKSAIHVNHFYGIRADDPWMWGAFDMAGMPDIFLTHTKKNDARRVGAYRTDMHKVAQLVRLYGPQGEQGLQTMPNGRGGESFRLEDLMKVNTRHAVPERGVAEGVRMPDGSEFNEKKGHKSALTDALATLGLKLYMRRIAPDVMRLAETNADFETIREFVHGANGFDDHPVLGMGRVYRGKAAGHMGMLVNIDEEHGDFKNALFVRLDVDLGRYTYQGKRLLEMNEDELSAMIREQGKSPDALFQHEHLRKNPLLVPAKMAFEAGRNNKWGAEQLEDNRIFMLENPDFLDRAMRAWDKAQPQFKKPHQLANPLPEEEIFTNVGDLPRYSIKDREGRITLIPDAIHARAEDIRNHGRNVDRQLKFAIEPDAIEWDPERPGAVDEFHAKLKRTSKALERYRFNDPEVNKLIDRALAAKTPERAVERLWEMRRGLMFKFHDYSLSYEVQDERGNQVPFADLTEMQGFDMHARLDSGRLNVQFEQLRSAPTARKIARMFWDEGRIDMLGDAWSQYVKAEIAHYQQGMPNLDPEDQRLMTIPRSLKEIEKILANERGGANRRADTEAGETGQFDRFAAGTDQAVEMMEALKGWLEERARRFPFTDEAKVQMGWDPRTGFPIEHIKYEIEGSNTIVVDVPDRHLENPLSDRNVAAHFVMMYGPKGVDLEQALHEGKSLVLRGAETGKMYLAPGAETMSAPPKGDFPEIYRKAEAGYADSGYVLPRNNGQMLVVASEMLVPLANTRAIDETVQAVKVAKREDFEALVSPALGYRDQPLTGLVMRRYEFVPQAGKVRLQETDSEGVETGWEVEGEVASVREMTLLDLRHAIRKKEIDDAAARRYGFNGTSDMQSRVSKMFDDELIRERRDDRPGSTSHETFLLVDLKGEVDRKTMSYLSHSEMPEASIKREFLGDRAPQFDLEQQQAPSSLKPLAEAANDQRPKPKPGKDRRLG